MADGWDHRAIFLHLHHFIRFAYRVRVRGVSEWKTRRRLQHICTSGQANSVLDLIGVGIKWKMSGIASTALGECIAKVSERSPRISERGLFANLLVKMNEALKPIWMETVYSFFPRQTNIHFHFVVSTFMRPQNRAVALFVIKYTQMGLSRTHTHVDAFGLSHYSRIGELSTQQKRQIWIWIRNTSQNDKKLLLVFALGKKSPKHSLLLLSLRNLRNVVRVCISVPAIRCRYTAALLCVHWIVVSFEATDNNWPNGYVRNGFAIATVGFNVDRVYRSIVAALRHQH